MSDTLKMVIESKSVNEGFARAAVGAFIARLDPDLEQLNDVKTAVSEAVTNAIVHAYPDTVGAIHITMRADSVTGAVRISIKDTGRGIEDIARAREPMYTTGGAERSGMGFTVMESFMDSVLVRSKPGHGTTVTLTKHLKSRGDCR